MDQYDIAVIGGGVSGTALLYTLARYTSARRVVLVEKHERAGMVNSNARNNSQTLHVGDIETNYNIEKVKQVKPAASMVARYAEALPPHEREKILFPARKMVLAVGEEEVRALEERYEQLKPLFSGMQRLERKGIELIEPMIVKGRRADENILALRSDGFAVDYENLAQSFVSRARPSETGRTIDISFGARLVDIARERDGKSAYTLALESGRNILARAVVFDTDAYSLLFAKRLGYGREFSLIPVAGTFYFSREMLRGKVYTVQDPRLPFSSVHGDPDVRVPGKTRWGPTANFFPVLEARNIKTALDYFRVSGLHRWQTWVSFASILLEPKRLFYLMKNFLYELPLVGIYFYAKQVRKIVPSISGRDLSRAQGFGGMRLQRVNTNTRELLLGEGKIIGENIIFNMTPSPGASVCLYNAMRDAEALEKFFPQDEYRFDKERMTRELCAEPVETADVSQKDTYVS